MIEICPALSEIDMLMARELFLEYQHSLGVDLCFQNFAAECASLPGQYAPPRGRLVLAKRDAIAVGCAAIREVTSHVCEMKRLYVQPSARAAGLGRRLVGQLIAEARSIGYKQIVLDTLPSMDAAQQLYERLGFVDIPPYTNNPVPGARFLGLPL